MKKALQTKMRRVAELIAPFEADVQYRKLKKMYDATPYKLRKQFSRVLQQIEKEHNDQMQG